MEKRNARIDFIRLVFGIMMVIYHCNKFAGDSVYFAKGWYIGVEFFFLISGAFLAKSLDTVKEQGPKDNHIPRVFLRKIKNVYPLYLITWLVAFGVTEAVSHAALKESAEKLFHSAGSMLLLEMTGMDTLSKYWLPGSWYISAMLLAMLLVLCIYEISGKWFYQVIAPVLVIIFLGYFNQTYGRIHRTHDWTIFIYSGTVRGAAEMLMGAVCYKTGEWMRSRRYGALKKKALRILETVCYAVVIIASYFFAFSSYDFIYLILLAVGVTLSLGIESECSAVFKKLAKLGKKASLPIYLNHLWLIYLIKKIEVDMVTKIVLLVFSLIGSCIVVTGIRRLGIEILDRYSKYRENVIKRELEVSKHAG